ncbi:hypothetical protein JANAI62_37600 [Jannaschia pagri]|uniref:Antirestriction protein (ArdA) n=1 Tax=Jannaschia pagri TaxID=2829797 RepID=A0ABQ4NSN6_9RHOB|nr:MULTISPECIES: antirestriction protein ArdA [unclassified Jannaschia]GIT93333.1 hypothetical protein JANAI61_37910 [Jannaschia sp. AI_61]GIT97137.1 hypothetical protein JANAI62_37600 [Jannaschia sp. AI_62]
MTVTLHAQPYDIQAVGFYFTSFDEYAAKAAVLRNDFGDPVEEFELQFIDGEAIDCALAGAVGLYQNTIRRFFEIVDAWDEDEKTRVILAVGDCGYAFDVDTTPDDFDLDIYEYDNLRELAEQFVEEGVFGDIPERLAPYLDYEAIGRDLGMDYSEAEIAGKRLIYRCG